MNLDWRKPLIYVVWPILLLLCFVGFPPPFAPPRATRPSQEQVEMIEEDQEDGR